MSLLSSSDVSAKAASVAPSSALPVDALQLQHWLNAGDVVLVDVREADEFAAQRIANAVWLPFTQLESHLPDVRVGPRKLVFQCAQGPRSLAAARKAQALMSNVDLFYLDGGLLAWQQAGLALVGAQEAGRLPLMRQVMIVAGSLMLISALLVVLKVPYAITLGAFVGSGLLLAGTTGWCGMAKLLQRMPWNR